MARLLEFICNHWLLVSALLSTLAVLMLDQFSYQLMGISTLTTQATIRLMSDKACLLLDLRSAQAFASGHIRGAINFALDQQQDKLVLNLPPDAPKKSIILIGHGHGAELALHTVHRALKKSGAAALYVLQGGMSGWQSAGLPMDQSP